MRDKTFYQILKHVSAVFPFAVTGLILGLCPANERRRYKVTPSLIGWGHTWNQPWDIWGSMRPRRIPLMSRGRPWHSAYYVERGYREPRRTTSALQRIQHRHDLHLDCLRRLACFWNQEPVHTSDCKTRLCITRSILECDQFGMTFFGSDFDDTAQCSLSMDYGIVFAWRDFPQYIQVFVSD